MPDLGPVYDAWHSGARLPAIALLALLLTSLVRKWAPTFWGKLPDAWKRWIPMGIAMLESFGEYVLSAGSDKPVGVVALNGILAGLMAIGGHHFLNPLKHAALTPAEPQSASSRATGDGDSSMGPAAVRFSLWTGAALTALALFAIWFAPGCSTVKPAARSVVDASRILCETFFAERAGVSVEEAGRLYCSTEKQLRPWIDEALSAQQAAGATAAAAE
jgi:hypothetical protein